MCVLKLLTALLHKSSNTKLTIVTEYLSEEQSVKKIIIVLLVLLVIFASVRIITSTYENISREKTPAVKTEDRL